MKFLFIIIFLFQAIQLQVSIPDPVSGAMKEQADKANVILGQYLYDEFGEGYGYDHRGAEEALAKALEEGKDLPSYSEALSTPAEEPSFLGNLWGGITHFFSNVKLSGSVTDVEKVEQVHTVQSGQLDIGEQSGSRTVVDNIDNARTTLVDEETYFDVTYDADAIEEVISRLKPTLNSIRNSLSSIFKGDEQFEPETIAASYLYDKLKIKYGEKRAKEILLYITNNIDNLGINGTCSNSLSLFHWLVPTANAGGMCVLSINGKPIEIGTLRGHLNEFGDYMALAEDKFGQKLLKLHQELDETSFEYFILSRILPAMAKEIRDGTLNAADAFNKWFFGLYSDTAYDTYHKSFNKLEKKVVDFVESNFTKEELKASGYIVTLVATTGGVVKKLNKLPDTNVTKGKGSGKLSDDVNYDQNIKPKLPSYKHLEIDGVISEDRIRHILDGELNNPNSGGHRFGMGRTSADGTPKSEFPANWSDEKIIQSIADVATNPNSTRVQQTGRLGADFTNRGKPTRTKVQGNINGTDIEVIIEPAGEGIITGYPVK